MLCCIRCKLGIAVSDLFVEKVRELCLLKPIYRISFRDLHLKNNKYNKTSEIGGRGKYENVWNRFPWTLLDVQYEKFVNFFSLVFRG